jgi:hypothetical protein
MLIGDNVCYNLRGAHMRQHRHVGGDGISGTKRRHLV